MTDMSLPQPIVARVLDLLTRAVLAPIRAFRLQYLPLLMVYFAYGVRRSNLANPTAPGSKAEPK